MNIKDDAKYYNLETEYTPIPGTNVTVLLEFPELGPNGNSLFIKLDDVMTVSHSVYRSKIRVIPLGASGTVGYGLGTRLVAGSVIRSMFATDKLTKLQENIYVSNAAEIQSRLLAGDTKLPNNATKKDFLSVMKDDLSSFNIHLVSQSETILGGKVSAKYEVIYGCVIINTGQVYSIEDLMSEATFSYEAKAIRSITDVGNPTYQRGFQSASTIKSGSDLL